MKRWQLIVFLFILLTLPVTTMAQFVVKELNAPGTEPRGVAWDGQYLWCADLAKDSLYKIDPSSGQILHIIPFDFDLTYGGGTTCDGDSAIWVTMRNYFYKLDAQTGQELANVHCPGG